MAAAVQTGVENSAAPVKPVLDVVVLYEDLSTALRAKQSLDLLAEQLRAKVGIRVRWWRLDLLREPLLAEQAAIEAAGSGVIMLSLHGHSELRAEVCGWLMRWLNHKTDQPCALTALLDPDPAHPSHPPPVVARLKQFAAAGGADLFCSARPPRAATAAPTQGRTCRPAALPRGGQESQPAGISPANAA